LSPREVVIVTISRRVTAGGAMVAIAFVASAWGPRFGGINAFNADLCRSVATVRPDVDVYCLTGGVSQSEVNKGSSAVLVGDLTS